MKIYRILSSIFLLLSLAACSALGGNNIPDLLVVEEEAEESSADDGSIVVDTTSAQTSESQSRLNAPTGLANPASSQVLSTTTTTIENTTNNTQPQPEGTEELIVTNYGVNPFVETSQDNLSTFAMDVDTASYTLTRSHLLDYRQLPPSEAIRPEEFINYYPSEYAAPTDGSAFSIQMDAAPSPFSADGQILLRVGIQGQVVAAEDRAPALLIFVIDISGSMEGPTRLDLVKESLAILSSQLREDDRVGIVVYSDTARVVLEPTAGSEQDRILSAINSLQTEGSTYVEEGLRLGYNMALANMQEGQISRIIILSDGVANVGATGPDAILQTVKQGVDAGVTLSTIGFGMGSFNDVLMEQLANDGNGNYYYIDNLREARRVFAFNLTSTLQVIGYDARIQVEFDPSVVATYRLIGYENRAIADESFRDDTIDAGEVGAGHSISALYELELVDGMQSGTIAIAHLRYEEAENRQVMEISQSYELESVFSNFADAPADFQLMAALAEFSEILRQSPFADTELNEILDVVAPLAQTYPVSDELANLIRTAIALQ